MFSILSSSLFYIVSNSLIFCFSYLLYKLLKPYPKDLTALEALKSVCKIQKLFAISLKMCFNWLIFLETLKTCSYTIHQQAELKEYRLKIPENTSNPAILRLFEI